MAVSLGVEAFPRASSAVAASELTVRRGASPVNCGLLDGLQAHNRTDRLLRIAGDFVTMPGVVVP